MIYNLALDTDKITRGEAGLQHALGLHNADRAAQIPPLAAFTAEEYLTFLLENAVESWAAEFVVAEGQKLKDAVANATDEEIQAAKDALKIP